MSHILAKCVAKGWFLAKIAKIVQRWFMLCSQGGNKGHHFHVKSNNVNFGSKNRDNLDWSDVLSPCLSDKIWYHISYKLNNEDRDFGQQSKPEPLTIHLLSFKLCFPMSSWENQRMPNISMYQLWKLHTLGLETILDALSRDLEQFKCIHLLKTTSYELCQLDHALGLVLRVKYHWTIYWGNYSWRSHLFVLFAALWYYS